MKERPPVVTSRLGKFVGTINFRGERGYTQVSARNALGDTGDPLANTPKKLRCDFRESEAERERELESVSLNGAPPRAAISFNASRLFGDFPALAGSGKPLPPKGDRYLFLALASEKVGRMSILRSTGALGESRDFAVDDDLAVPMPGLGTVKLTGGKAELATVAEGLKHRRIRPLRDGDAGTWAATAAAVSRLDS
jgi:hypothetical protein